MPLGALDRFALPLLTTYSILSAVLLSSVIYNGLLQSKDNPSAGDREVVNGTSYLFEDDEHLIDIRPFNFPDSIKTAVLYIIDDVFSRWIFINAITCVVVLFGKALQLLVFGDLRAVEVMNFRERLCNYFLYKCIFMFGIIKVQTAEDVILLLGWFGVLGFLQIFVQFSKDRLEYLITTSSNVSIRNRFKIIFLLVTLYAVASFMIYLCLIYVVNLGYNMFAFMIAECLSVYLRVPHILIKYVIDPLETEFIRDQNRHLSQNFFLDFLLNKTEVPYTYYLLLSIEVTDLCLELLHYLHMLLWGNIFFSVASFAICMHVRYLMTEIQKKIKKHRNYMWILSHMEKEYPIATENELAENSDNCAICWEKMDVARKLPCKHLFHSVCLQLWLEQDTSCPTCRFVLNTNGSNIASSISSRANRRIFRLRPRGRGPVDRHFFHFDGSRYVSWLPSFSVQVMSSLSVPEIPDSQLQAMAAQVQHVFPHYPIDLIIENLRQTRSVNITSNNILEGLLPLPNNNLHFEESLQNMDMHAAPVTSIIPDHPVASSSSSSYSRVGKSSHDIGTSDLNVIGKEFSPTPSERELALQKRKEQLLRKAQQKFLEKDFG